MKQLLKLATKQLLADRAALFLVFAIILSTIVYTAYIAFSLKAGDLQLQTRFTSFGETHFYRTKWFYLLSFIGFGLLFALLNVGAIIKLQLNGMRSLAIAFGWFSIILLILAFVYTSNVLGIAYLA